MKTVGDEEAAERLQAWVDTGIDADAVLWLGFDDRGRLARHAFVVPDTHGIASAEDANPLGSRQLDRLTRVLR